MSVRRSAIGTAPARAGDVGAVEDALTPHASHHVVDGACELCAARVTWPRIEQACPSVPHWTKKTKKAKDTEAVLLQKRLARLRGER